MFLNARPSEATAWFAAIIQATGQLVWVSAVRCCSGLACPALPSGFGFNFGGFGGFNGGILPGENSINFPVPNIAQPIIDILSGSIPHFSPWGMPIIPGYNGPPILDAEPGKRNDQSRFPVTLTGGRAFQAWLSLKYLYILRQPGGKLRKLRRQGC
jgi:hypothetical protein